MPKKLRGERPTSYPYISGDTFRAICDARIENDEDLNKFILMAISGLNIKTVFFSLSYIHNNEKNIMEKLNLVNSSFFSKIKLILHNGDKIPSISLFEYLKKLFKKIYCVNIINESENIISIPIGLENYHYFNNGRLSEFQDFNKMLSSNKREIIISSCFSLATNYEKRKEISETLKNSYVFCVSNKLSRSEYINLMKNSLFTISPPGNGDDCHRTWEAIYFKTIPVVLNGFLSKFMCDNLPIYSVNSYTELLHKSDNDLYEIYNDLIEHRSNSLAYFDYWYREIVVND